MSESSAERESPDDDLSMLADDPQLARMFIAETVDHLSSIEALVLRLESSPDDAELLNDIFRPFHTLKGNAGALGLTSLQSCAHTVETLLDRARSGRHTIGSAEVEVILRAVDVLSGMIVSVRDRLAGQPGRSADSATDALVRDIETILHSSEGPPAVYEPTAVEGTARPHPDASRSVVKVDTERLDALVDLVGELMVAQSIIRSHPALMRTDEPLARALDQLARVTGALQQAALGMRMTPLRLTFQKLARLVRELSRHAGKPVRLELAGDDIELDRKVIEEIQDPLMHMVRNSIDHGIEPAGERAAAGKPATARLSIRASHEGGSVVIAISDDGAGLPTGKIRDTAIRKGWVAEDAALSEQDIHELIFRPGFSTADQVTEVSGRGVGMDVVRRNVHALHGHVDVHTATGAGTTFRLRVPLTLAMVHGLLVKLGDDQFLIPTSSIRQTLEPDAGGVGETGSATGRLDIRERTIAIARLADVLGFAERGDNGRRDVAVVLEDGGRQAAVIVDELVGTQDVVVKPLGAAFARVRGIAGAAVLGDGRVGLILDPAGVIALVDQPASPEAA